MVSGGLPGLRCWCLGAVQQGEGNETGQTNDQYQQGLGGPYDPSEGIGRSVQYSIDHKCSLYEELVSAGTTGRYDHPYTADDEYCKCSFESQVTCFFHAIEAQVHHSEIHGPY